MDVAPGFKKTFLIVLTQLILLVVGLSCAFYFVQEKILFAPHFLAQDYKFHFKSAVEEFRFDFEGTMAHGLVFKKGSPRGVILFLHGNATDVAGWGVYAEEMAAKTGHEVWIVDYPGFGKSQGRIQSEAQLHRFSETIFNEVTKGLGGRHLILYGRSMGTGLAVRLASQHQVSGLILEAPYTNFAEVFWTKYFWTPRFLFRYHISAESWMAEVGCPILILHGEKDKAIPLTQGQKLASLNPQARLVILPDGHHRDLMKYPVYWTEYARFLHEIERKNSP